MIGLLNVLGRKAKEANLFLINEDKNKESEHLLLMLNQYSEREKSKMFLLNLII